MSAIQVGRVITKLVGREAGLKAVIISVIDQKFVFITGAGFSKIKRRRVNVQHIDVMDILIAIDNDATDSKVKIEIEKNTKLKELFENPIKY